MNRSIMTNTIALRKRMFENGFKSVTSLSEASKINRNTLGKVLNGTVQPSSVIMYKLAIVLKLTPEDAGRIFFAPDLRTA